jgi:hypothetical protein
MGAMCCTFSIWLIGRVSRRQIGILADCCPSSVEFDESRFPRREFNAKRWGHQLAVTVLHPAGSWFHSRDGATNEDSFFAVEFDSRAKHYLKSAAPALHTSSSCAPVPPEQPIAPTILPPSISGMPPRAAITPSSVMR